MGVRVINEGVVWIWVIKSCQIPTLNQTQQKNAGPQGQTTQHRFCAEELQPQKNCSPAKKKIFPNKPS